VRREIVQPGKCPKAELPGENILHSMYDTPLVQALNDVVLYNSICTAACYVDFALP